VVERLTNDPMFQGLNPAHENDEKNVLKPVENEANICDLGLSNLFFV
jgi:hypothetical protein